MTTKKRWTNEEIAYLKRYLEEPKGLTYRDVATRLDRSYSSVSSMIGELRKKGQLKVYISKPWSQMELDYLQRFVDNPEKDTIADVAKFLGRTRGAVSARLVLLRKNGSSNLYLYRNWSMEDIKILKKMNGKYSLKIIASRLGRTIDSVRWKRRKLGLTSYDYQKPHKVDREIKALAEKGYFRKDIADLLNLNYNSLCGYILRKNIICAIDIDAQKRAFEKYCNHHKQELNFIFKR